MSHDLHDRLHRHDDPQRTSRHSFDHERTRPHRGAGSRERDAAPLLGDPVAAIEAGLADARVGLARVEKLLAQLRDAVDPGGPREMKAARALARKVRIDLTAITSALGAAGRWLPLVPELAADYATVRAQYADVKAANAELQAQSPADYRDPKALARAAGRGEAGKVFAAEEDRASQEWNASLDARAAADRARERPAATLDAPAEYEETRATLDVGAEAPAAEAIEAVEPPVDRRRTREPATLDAPAEYEETRATLDVGGDAPTPRAAPETEPSVDRRSTRAPATSDPAAVYDEDRDTLDIGPVQRKANGASAAFGDEHAIAAAGVSSASASLPHLEAIQASFGRHDVTHVRASIGGAAAGASDALGAEAYATGDRVAFREAPSLHTAAHEAAHVVQQRAGVSLKGGVGEAGDAYEQQADSVADAVVRGDSAETLLDRMAEGPQSPSLQRKAKAKEEFGDAEAIITLRLLFRDIAERARVASKGSSKSKVALGTAATASALAEAERVASLGSPDVLAQVGPEARSALAAAERLLGHAGRAELYAFTGRRAAATESRRRVAQHEQLA